MGITHEHGKIKIYQIPDTNPAKVTQQFEYSKDYQGQDHRRQKGGKVENFDSRTISIGAWLLIIVVVLTNSDSHPLHKQKEPNFGDNLSFENFLQVFKSRGYFHIRRSGGLAPKFAFEICVGAPDFASKTIGHKYPKLCPLNFRYDPRIGILS